MARWERNLTAMDAQGIWVSDEPKCPARQAEPHANNLVTHPFSMVRTKKAGEVALPSPLNSIRSP